MSEVRHAILGTAGHIDHGKSTLVRVLTGTDPDRLPEEKKRGVTIELGFAHLTLNKEDAPNYELGIVDVPGHSDFVSNMVAGVGGMNLAIFAVAADDGWMPQSEEHLHILHYLGVSRIIIALTKSDLSEDIDFACEFVRESLQNTPYADAEIIPVSSHTGDGIDTLKQSIRQTLDELPPTPDYQKPMLPVDRAFIVKGMGTVVTGTLLGGPIKLGDSLTMHPGQEASPIRSIQNHSQAIESALPGMRTALNLPEFQVGSRKKLGIHRGCVLTSPGAGEGTDTINVQLTRLAREIPGQPETLKPLKSTQRVRCHYGSDSIGARLIFGEGKILEPGQKAIVQLRLDEPLFAMVGDHLVIRDWSGQATLAGGVVLDPQAKRRGFRESEKQEHLEKLAKVAHEAAEALPRLLKHSQLTTPAEISERLKISPGNFEQQISSLVSSGKASRMGPYLADAAWWKGLLKSAGKHINDYHRKNPDLAGLPLQDFRNLIAGDIPSDEIFHELLEALTNSGFSQNATVLMREGFTPGLPDDLAEPVRLLEARLSESPLNPPGRSELEQEAPTRRALGFLIRTGRVIKLDDKAVLLTTARDSARQQVLDYINTHGKATASELRQHLESSRRIVMPLLEDMDASGLTKRDGDYRTVI